MARTIKYFVAAKDHSDPLVLAAADPKEASAKWAKCTGRKSKDAVPRRIGTQAETITRAELEPVLGEMPETVEEST